ncbi:MAG: alpha/beta hydrolase, partial [Myxococcota bacterium]
AGGTCSAAPIPNLPDGELCDLNGVGDGVCDDGVCAVAGPEVQREAAYEVEVTTLTYAQGQTHDDWRGAVNGTVDLILDLYEPIGAPQGRPAVIVMHGGGFVGGTRNNSNSEGFARYFAERGFVAINIDYRIASDRGTIPQEWADFIASFVPVAQRPQGYALYPAARDAKAAVRWLYANAESYGVDTDYVTSIGGSAGSFLAIMLGVTDEADFRDELDQAEDPTLASTNLGAGAKVHTIIDHWGGISHAEALEMIDGRSRFDESDAPVSIVHGTADSTVLFEEAEKLRDAYDQTGVPYAFYPVVGGGHGIWGTIIEGLTLQELAFEFVLEQQRLQVAD